MMVEIREVQTRNEGALTVAKLTDNDGHYYGFSRWSDETDWYLDTHIGHNGYPYFVHGEGSRCCAKQVADGAWKEAIEAAYKRWQEAATR